MAMNESPLQNITLKVTPEVLVSKSEEVTKRINQMSLHFDQLFQLIEKTKGYWVGEAGDKHRTLYKDMTDDIDEMLSRLKEHPVDLVTIAQQYSDVELKIEQEIASLPGDIIL